MTPGALIFAALVALAVAAGATGYAAFGRTVRPGWIPAALALICFAIGLIIAAAVLA